MYANLCYFRGNATGDAEVKTFESGRTLARFSLAVNRGKNKDGSDMGVDFINVQSWKPDGKESFDFKQACDVKRGDRVIVFGRLKIDKRDDRVYVNLTASSVDNVSEFARYRDRKAGEAPEADESDAPF